MTRCWEQVGPAWRPGLGHASAPGQPAAAVLACPPKRDTGQALLSAVAPQAKEIYELETPDKLRKAQGYREAGVDVFKQGKNTRACKLWQRAVRPALLRSVAHHSDRVLDGPASLLRTRSSCCACHEASQAEAFTQKAILVRLQTLPAARAVSRHANLQPGQHESRSSCRSSAPAGTLLRFTASTG